MKVTGKQNELPADRFDQNHECIGYQAIKLSDWSRATDLVSLIWKIIALLLKMISNQRIGYSWILLEFSSKTHIHNQEAYHIISNNREEIVGQMQRGIMWHLDRLNLSGSLSRFLPQIILCEIERSQVTVKKGFKMVCSKVDTAHLSRG